MMQAIKALSITEEAYLEQFGPDSLDRVLLLDPLRAEARDYIGAERRLRRAMAAGIPLEQADEDLWKELIF